MDRLKNNSTGLLVILFFVTGIFAPSCKRDNIDSSPSAKLGFSTDTVLFDTVFTIHGGGVFPRSVNKRLIVHNRNSQTVKTNIRLAGGSASAYRINIDGERTTQVTDYEIMGGDSIYIFVEVSIDPRSSNNPLIVKDSIEFETNGNRQDIKLVAWGQDAYYFNAATSTNDTAWMDNAKPYVIYNYFQIPKNRKLTIGPGVKIYSDVDAGFVVEGTIEINGNKDNRVQLQGARLGQEYKDLPGQWFGIWIRQTSINNVIKYADIQNAFVGIRCDSLSLNSNPKVLVENTLIKNMSGAGVLAYTSKIKMVNCCVANCGQYTFGADFGGDYELNHCTFANYSGTFSRQKPSFVLTNNNYQIPGTSTAIANPLKLNLQNSIIYGSLREEIEIGSEGQGQITFVAPENNLLRTELTRFTQFGNNKFNISPRFKDVNDLNFKLDTLSPAKDILNNPTVFIDLEGTFRDSKPDAGAYERIE